VNACQLATCLAPLTIVTTATLLGPEEAFALVTLHVEPALTRFCAAATNTV
jgi:hypothetical protein